MSRPRKIAQYTIDGEMVKTYDSIKEAQDYMGLTHISAVCRGRRRTDGGFTWAYITPDPNRELQERLYRLEMEE
ncbi:MAG: hypothetical protein KBS83_01000 [Lachnospiraceae bacterium]|nr:hypothetical protein [Candidatus Equihabitans merdae]